MAQGVDIILLGKNYRVACPEGEEDKLRRAADELSQRLETLKEKTRVNSTEHLAIMVGLHLAYELHKEQAQNQNYADNMNQRIVELQRTIERALLEQSQPNIDQLFEALLQCKLESLKFLGCQPVGDVPEPIIVS